MPMEEVMSGAPHQLHDPSAARHDRMWLAHHGPEHTERCLHVHGVAVCRRCAVLYPVAVLTALVVVLTDPPMGWMLLAMWVLPVPMVAEWVGEHVGGLRYSPTRQVGVTAIAAPALGVAVAIHAVEPFSVAAVAPVAVWSVVCAGTAAWGWWRSVPDVAPNWEQHHLDDEAARRAHLDSLLAVADEQLREARS